MKCVFQMKRMKQIEQEKDVLIQGLTAVDKTREWYLKQISATQEKIKHVARMGSHVVRLCPRNDTASCDFCYKQ